MTATAPKGLINQMGNWTKSPASRSEIRSDEGEKRALLRESSEWTRQELAQLEGGGAA